VVKYQAFTEHGARHVKFSDLGTYALSSCASVAFLAGCGGSQYAIGAPGPVPRTSAVAAPAVHGKSWMMPEAKSEDLLYADVSSENADILYVFSYPKGKLVGTLYESGAQYQQGLCSDSRGHVFVTTLSSDVFGGNIYEYAHAGTKPIETLYEQGLWPWGCSVDPSTGNLAVSSINYDTLPSGVEIYPDAKGTPKLYSDNEIVNYTFCGYDDKGNLFVDGTGNDSKVHFAELPKGSGTLVNVNLSKSINWFGQVQWDGAHITLEDEPASAVYRLKVSGSTALVVGTTRLSQWTDTQPAQSWIQNQTIIQPNGASATEIRFWPYPAGGKPSKTVSSPALFGVTVSRAPR
jgi:hypothetical protein